MNGIELIATERKRQIEEEGFTAERDGQYKNYELAAAAACYAMPVPIYTVEFCGDGDTHDVWPWSEDYKEKMESTAMIRSLVIAGALIAAEIDRLQRASDL